MVSLQISNYSCQNSIGCRINGSLCSEPINLTHQSQLISIHIVGTSTRLYCIWQNSKFSPKFKIETMYFIWKWFLTNSIICHKWSKRIRMRAFQCWIYHIMFCRIHPIPFSIFSIEWTIGPVKIVFHRLFLQTLFRKALKRSINSILNWSNDTSKNANIRMRCIFLNQIACSWRIPSN